jgi:hypothetical protein
VWPVTLLREPKARPCGALANDSCITGTIGLPNPNQAASRKRPGFSILIYTGIPLGVPRERFLALEGEGIT